MNTKRKREQLLRLRSPRYRQTPLHLKRVKLTPSGVNHLLSLGAQFTNLANLGEQESKRTLNVYVCFYLSQPIGITVLRVQHLLEYRINNLIYNLIEVLLLDAAKATSHVTLNVTCKNLTLYKAGLGKRVTHNHLVSQRIGILGI